MNDLLTGICTVWTPAELLRTPSRTSPEREQVVEAMDAHLQVEHKQADVGQLLKLLGQRNQGVEGGLRQGWYHGKCSRTRGG